MTHIKLKVIGKPLSRAAEGTEVAASAAHAPVRAQSHSPGMGTWDGGSGTGCQPGTALETINL